MPDKIHKRKDHINKKIQCTGPEAGMKKELRGYEDRYQKRNKQECLPALCRTYEISHIYISFHAEISLLCLFSALMSILLVLSIDVCF